jgi:holo-[acyl-carrier protein] synthase
MILGIGIDLVDVDRLERLLANKGDRALRRLFTDREVAYAMAKAFPARHLAARVAAKEATFKALSSHPDARAIGWREMEVVSRADGAPAIELHGRGIDCAAALGVTRILITLTHSDTAAAAFVVVEGSGLGQGEGG